MFEERYAALKDSYEQLGLKEGASIDTVKATYRSLALKLHPDKNLANPSSTPQFQALSEAYERVMEHFLGSEINVGGKGSGFGPPNGFYSFGVGGKRGPARPDRPKQPAQSAGR
ncbi:DnaJ-domain-containing protein [Calocera viscosa TUFC12733]|uniref:DnaJ-domain-containing protein n=1 Tax=Calocera viscosa (strain TUFC12733) TaxID=1330018 RepID=A0A167P7H5_CALVF|nr:DnaJ-domain-containing protein [Calocera viscosa TUFC12733]